MGRTSGGAGSASLRYQTSYLGANKAGNDTLQNLASVALGAGTWLIVGFVGFSDSVASAELAEIDLTTTSGSRVGEFASQLVEIGAATGGVEQVGQFITSIQHFSASTTVYLCFQCSANGTALGGSPQNYTGLYAVQIA